MEHAGSVVTVGNPTAAERDAILLHFAALRAQKHAVVCDEIQHSDGPNELRVLHYATCLKCAETR